MTYIFVDTNVVVDLLDNREPFSFDAATLFEFVSSSKLKIYISAISYGNIYYILRKSSTKDIVIDLLEELANLTEIIDVTGAIIRQSLHSGFKDYEDAIQYCCALSIPDIDFIVTRDKKDFRQSALAVLSPAEANNILASITE